MYFDIFIPNWSRYEASKLILFINLNAEFYAQKFLYEFFLSEKIWKAGNDKRMILHVKASPVIESLDMLRFL